jgi:hypothetical protein
LEATFLRNVSWFSENFTALYTRIYDPSELTLYNLISYTVYPISPIRTTRSAHLTLLYLISSIILGKCRKAWNCSLCSLPVLPLPIF